MTKLAELEPRAFVDQAEELGELEEEVLEAYAHEHELDEEEVSALRAELEERGVEVIATPHAEPVARAAVPTSGAIDSLTLFMNEAGRWPLLTAAEEQGRTTISGLAMFTAQAAEQFRLWTGRAAPERLFERVARETLESRARG